MVSIDRVGMSRRLQSGGVVEMRDAMQMNYSVGVRNITMNLGNGGAGFTTSWRISGTVPCMPVGGRSSDSPGALGADVR